MSLESGGLRCVGALGRNLSSVAVKMFSYVIGFKNKIYIFFLLSMRFEKIMLQYIHSITVNTK
jgi:hypothetical protein